MSPVFDFTDYKAYLRRRLDELGQERRGVRTRFAESVGCKPGYVTQILNGKADLSLEQMDLASRFLGHGEEEADFFLLLVMHERARSKSLRERIERQIQRSQEKRLELKNRLKVGAIREADQTVFYSSWHYLAILTMLSVPRFQSKDALARQLGLPLRTISDAMDMMEGAGLVAQKGGRYVPGTSRTHLGEDSPMAARHHVNWRHQAVQAIERHREKGFHYSSVVSLAEKDARRIRKLLVEAVEEAAKIIAPSIEEKVCVLSMDFFDL